MPLVKRTTKGSELTHQEMDDNLQYLEDLASAGGTSNSASFTESVLTISGDFDVKILSIELTQEIVDYVSTNSFAVFGFIEINDDYDAGNSLLQTEKRRYVGELRIRDDGKGGHYIDLDRQDIVNSFNYTSSSNKMSNVGDILYYAYTPNFCYHPSMIDINFVEFDVVPFTSPITKTIEIIPEEEEESY